MITAIDFGCYGIRSARRSADQNAQIALIDERSEYVVISPQDDCVKTLAELEVPSRNVKMRWWSSETIQKRPAG